MIPLPADLQSLYDKENNLYHPKTQKQVCAFVSYAANNGLQVRVRGAAQSVQEAVFADGFAQDDAPVPANINLQLDRLRRVRINKKTMEVTVGAGCNLSVDPFDPSGVSSEANGLFTKLAAHGWVLPNVPPVAHQTVAGYIATGSEGGSVSTSFSEQVMAIRLVDGTGQIKTFRRSDDLNDPFYAVGVSMGLLGIVVSVTLACLPGFDVAGYRSVNVVGSEITTTQDKAPYSFGELVDPSKPSLETMLRTTPYTRLLWWPYSELRWLITWQAHPMTQADEPFVNQGPMPYEPHFPAITLPGFPLLPLPPGLAPAAPPTTLPISTRLPSEMVASVGFWLINNWPNWYKELTTNLFSEAPSSPFWTELSTKIEQDFPALYKMLMSFYFSPDKPLKPFWDIWWKGLTIDTFEFSNKLFNLDYTELWVPLNQAQEVIAILDAYYKADGFAATEVYAVEISGAKASNFWLSPGYDTDTIRINIMHFADSVISSADYYAQFWTLLYEKQIPFRPHWGKMLPPADGLTGATYLAQQYTKLDQFKTLRTRTDPKNVFLTSYWKKHLAL